MKRAIFAVAVVASTLVPALVVSVWLFGCCVLPFHRAIHRLLPLCRIAMAMGHSDRSDQQPATAPQHKQRPAPRIATEPTPLLTASVVAHSSPLIVSAQTAYRSFITLGAVRCDRDVGRHTLLATFVI